MFLRESERRSNGICRYSVSLITEGACKASRCECSMWPLCSSMRATPLKIITTARRSVHTLIGSKEAFRTKTRAFMVEGDITRARRKVSKLCQTRAVRKVLSTGGRHSLNPAELIRGFDQDAQISRLHNRMSGVRRDMYFCFRPGAMKVPGTGRRAGDALSCRTGHPQATAGRADV